VLNDLAGFINGFNLVSVFSILLDPGFVLLVSEGLFRSVGVLVLFDILGSLSDFLFSFSEGIGGVLSQFGKGVDLGVVIVDLIFHIGNEFIACSFIGFVD
jgi:hypothetical protein